MALAPLSGFDRYSVAWLNTKPFEMVAARALLNDEHGRPQCKDRGDDNNYFLGRVGQHNLVIACLPAGVSGAATVAAQLVRFFKSIRVCMLVGVGSGVPRDGSGNAAEAASTSPPPRPTYALVMLL